MTTEDFLQKWKFRARGRRPKFYPARIKPVERHLGVKKMARADGRQNYPPASATGPGASEQAITEALGNLLMDTTGRYKQGSDEYRSIVSEARGAWQEDRYGAIVADAGRKCQTVLRDALDEAEESWKRLTTAKDQLSHFREVHALRYEPIRYEGQFQKVSVLVAVMVGESLLNARMFSQASPEAWAGGFSEALIISAANVGFSAGCGYVMRLANARRLLMRRVGTVARIVWVPVIGFLHLLTAHYRDSLMTVAQSGSVANSLEAGREAMASLLANPLALQDYHSVLLVLLGLMASAVACVEGYKLDDPYPGYGEAARHAAQAKRDHADFKAEVLTRFSEIIEEARDEVRSAHSLAREKISAYESEVREALDYLRKYEGMFTYIQSSCARMLRLYRELNALERSEKCPAYFSDAIEVPITIDPELGGDLARTEAMMREFQSPEALREIKARADGAEGALDALETKFRDEALAAFDQVEGKML